MSRVFASWSGGKDSCLACYRAFLKGYEISCLLNMITEDGEQSWTHRLSPGWLKMQAQAAGIPLISKRIGMADYETGFTETLLDLKDNGVEGGVFGDIDIEEHREWEENVCWAAGMTAHLPLWGEDQDGIMKEFISSGFEAVVVVTRADISGEEWLGRKVDADFVKQLKGLEGAKAVTPCGESGEYHTFVTGGPLFKKRIEILEADKVSRDGYCFLEIKKCALKDK